MMDLNINLMLGFLFWVAFCLLLFVIDLKTEIAHWKNAAKAMECHANNLQTQIDRGKERLRQRLRDNIPKSVPITHPGNLQERCDILSELPCDSE